MVYVIAKDGTPLMPCSNPIARLLLKSGKAKVKRREPFTIKLTYETTKYTQNLVLGIDTGSGTFATAVVNENNEVLYTSEVTVRNDIHDKMEQRSMYRRNRRSRKTRYRQPRFLNRHNSTKEDRFSPTMISKIHSHIKEIEYIKSILPISKIVMETGTFDPHLMKNPELTNPEVKPWGYQHGPNYGFENTKAMVRNRDRYKCQNCGKVEIGTKIEVHHIVFRTNGGSDESENLICLCSKCHKKLHGGKIHPNFGGKTKGALKFATQMNSIRKQLLRCYPDAIETFGYITNANRLNLGIEKTHYNDACLIATGGKSFIMKCNLIRKRCISRGDFQQTKGQHSEVHIPTGKIHGLRKFEKVRYFGKEYFIKGRMSNGYAVLMDIDGNKIDFSNMPRGFKTPKLSNMRRIQARSSWMITTVALTQNTV